METDSTIVDRLVGLIAEYGLKVVAALVILFVGLWLAKKLKALLQGILTKRNVEETLVGFFGNPAYGALVVFVVIAAIGKLGVETTSFAAVVAAAGLAIGLALQGSLSNFASGVLIILFKPFKAGDFIAAGGETGIVVEVSLLTTELKTADNIGIIVPNSAVLSGSIKNFSKHPRAA